MSLPKRYDPQESEPRLRDFWLQAGINHFHPEDNRPVYSIDTPPPTVSGHLHLGHVYSYTHPDLFARFWRMRGYNVFYPMGYDDNGLPTERLVEKRIGMRAAETGRQAFIEKCLQVSEAAEKDYQALWQRMGLSIDWRYTYRTIDERSQRISQGSFIDLCQKGLAYRREAPAIWCPECRTAIAQAEVNDLERESEYVTLRFKITPEEDFLLIATTRPELLPACVAIFVHPDDGRYASLVGREAVVPLFGQHIPILADPGADPEKGTGMVMCCTFGDTADVAWWRYHQLPLVEAIDRQGRLAEAAGPYAGLTITEARRRIKVGLEEAGLLAGRQGTVQSVRVHERCDTPVEYMITRQWFVRVLDFKETFLKAGEAIRWHPGPMRARYYAWVENLNWDWCISRQRYFGVPFPVWYCQACGETVVAEVDQLPVDPTIQKPNRPCACGSSDFIPEEDVFDTWATSSLSPQIVGGWQGETTGQADGAGLFQKVFPFTLRPQAHEIIRTWAFYTIVKSHFHLNSLPWKDVLISGWGLAGEGQGKISKSRGGGPLPPMEMIERYSADALRYWASSTAAGKDSVISEEKIQAGSRLVTKLWNVARFCEPFLSPIPLSPVPLSFTPADRWILSRQQGLIRQVTTLMEAYDYATAKAEIEAFFWTELADNYLEMCKQRLYDEAHPQREGARFALSRLLRTLLKLFAPFLPFVTEAVYQGIFIAAEDREGKAVRSIHRSPWPVADPALEDAEAEAIGAALVDIATTVRRYKSEHNLGLGSELNRLQLAVEPGVGRQVTGGSRSPGDAGRLHRIEEAEADLKSITRARRVEVVPAIEPGLVKLQMDGPVAVALEL